ncbi:uncharacterized protein PAC_06846 [Phialocephala subalpina]|uniref:Uncharacterized protein n=1 Tax=Phialocephala subalpina TaxID=576137 RepID=A0A1L7WW01_9HELO|nr:uncharacterized protein PAC_06846 [Phialocephala subalpina]
MAEDFPICINLGLGHFTSAYITHVNEVVTVASVESSQEWKDFFLDTLPFKRSYEEKKKHANQQCVEAAVSSALSSILQATEEKLGLPVAITVISYPSHFQSSPYLSTLLRIAIKTYPEDLVTGYQVLLHLYSIKIAYSLNTSEAVGYGPGLDLDEYNSCSSMLTIRTKELADLKVRFKKLLDEQYQDNRCCQTHPEDFRFIIFSGEALPSEFLKIRDAVIEVVPAFSDKCRDEIDPHWVAAIGAAEQAKEYVLNPPVRRIGGMTEEGRKQVEEQDDEFRRLRNEMMSLEG